MIFGAPPGSIRAPAVPADGLRGLKVELVERDGHLAELGAIFEMSRTGKGQVVLVDGPPAVGRTALLWAAGQRATAAGFRFVSATCAPQERSLPMGVMTQVLQAIGAAGPPEDDDGDPVRLAAHAAAALLAAAGDTPLLIGVDDLRHADEQSLRCLFHLGRRIGAARVTIMLTDTADPDRPVAADLLRLPYARRMTLAPLTSAGIHDLVARTFDRATASRLTPVMDALSGGNPLLLQALLEDDLDGSGPTVQRYGRTFVSCLHRADLDCLRVAHALAVLACGAPDEEVTPLAGLDADAVRHAISVMDNAGLLQGGCFRHPAARLAVLADLSSADRDELYRRAAELAHARGASADEVGAHLVAAKDATAPWAPSVLREAAEHALLDSDPERAVACLRLALTAGLAPGPAAEFGARLAEARWQTNPAAAAGDWPALAADAAAGHLARRQIPTVIRGLLWDGRTGDAERLMERLRRQDAGSAEVADVDVWLGVVHPSLTRRRAGLSGADLPDPLSADPWARAAAGLADLFTRGRHSDAVTAARQTLRNVHLSRTSLWAAEATALALAVLTYRDQGDAVEDWCRQYLADADRRGTRTMTALVSAGLAEALLRKGDLAGAVSHAEAALAALPGKAWGVAVAMPLATAVQAHTRAGQHDRAARCLARALPEEALQSRYGLHYLHARGEYHLATGQQHAALADFLGCGELVRGWGLDDPGIVPWRTSAAEAWLSLGNADQARALAFDQLGRPGIDDSRARAAALRVLAAASTPGRRLQLLTEALEIFEARGDRIGQAGVLYDLSRAYHKPDQRRRARLLLRQALHVADLCGARPLYHELLDRARDAGDTAVTAGPANGLDSLTGSERRVASLAVMGYTNREIATKLYITASTVEQHLTRVYRKLDVKRRRDLPAGLWAERAESGRSARNGA
ncbi:AAA family ATPase [Actinoplanes sp. NPDC048967]|uniref:helix-turn-helix transcriptional regulator n=1 Tax=Actinoplanes sp. NPDC048967 TaxID=3155269 RepID=UPI0033FB3AA4